MRPWPDSIDLITICVAFGGLALCCGAGFFYMFCDFRAWLRACRRALVLIKDYFPGIPEWAKQQTPRSLLTFGLRLPCSEEDLLRAYRNKVKKLHPDKGGDKKIFLQFQTSFEEAREYLRDYNRN